MKLTRRRFLTLMAKSVTVGTAVLIGGCRYTCSPETLDIISRDTWGAAPPDIEGSQEGLYDATTNPWGWYVYQKPLEEVLTTIVVHHSALPLSDGPLEIQEKHMHTRGYADTGYQYIIGVEGEIYEARDIHVRGAHTGGHNTGSIGIALLGNFEETTPSDAQIESLKRLGRYLRSAYTLTHIAGHRDFQPGVTLCPGEHLEVRLPELAKELRLEFGTGGYIGPP